MAAPFHSSVCRVETSAVASFGSNETAKAAAPKMARQIAMMLSAPMTRILARMGIMCHRSITTQISTPTRTHAEAAARERHGRGAAARASPDGAGGGAAVDEALVTGGMDTIVTTRCTVEPSGAASAASWLDVSRGAGDILSDGAGAEAGAAWP